MLKKANNFIFLVVFIIWGFFAYPIILNKTPFPSKYQVSFFAPWNAYEQFAGPVKNNAQPDVVTQMYPWRNFAIKQFSIGQIPLWNPYSFGGTPHLANYQSAVFSPLNILFLFPLPFILVWGIIILLQPLLAGLFAYLFSRSLKISPLGSLISSLSFMFCGFITTWMSYGTLAYAVIVLPLALYCVQKYIHERKTVFLPLLSCSVAFSFLSGHFQTSLYFFIFLVSFVGFKLATEKNKKPIIQITAFILLGVLLVFFQILPTFEFYSQSLRSTLHQKFETIPWGYLPTLFAPDFYGNPVTRNDWFGHYAEWNGYIGVIGLALALFLFFVKKKKEIIFFLVLSLLSLVIAFDTPVIELIVNLRIPVLSTSAASRIIILYSFATAILAGYGFDELQKLLSLKTKRIFLWVLSVLLIFFVLFLISLLGIFDSQKSIVARNNLIFTSAILISFFIILITKLIIKNKRISGILTICIILLISFDVLRFAKKWQSFDPVKNVYPKIPITEYYEKSDNTNRYLGLIGGEDAVFYRKPILNGYDPLYIKRYGEFISFVATGDTKNLTRYVVEFPKRGRYTSRAINLLGVKYIVHKVSDGEYPWAFPFREYEASQFKKIFDDGKYRVFENLQAFTRAFVVYDYSVIYNSEKILNKIFDKNFNLQTSLVLEEDPKIKTSLGTAKTRILKYSANNVVIDVSSSSEGLLFLSDSYYPGWKAYVNGKRQKLLRANFAFRAVAVPKGKSLVIFSFEPESFKIGVVISFLSGLIIILYAFLIKKNEHRKF